MEHLVILLIQFVLWLDRLTLRPIRKAIPRFDELTTDPARVLAEDEVILGPSKRWFSSAALGALLSLVPWIGLTWLYLWGTDHTPGAPLNRGEKLVTLAMLLASVWLCVLAVQRWRRGGTLVLTAEAVEFHYRGTVVCCPWALFDTTGQPFFTSRERMLLPVNPLAVRHVRVLCGERVLAEGMHTRTKSLRFQSVNLAVVRAFYEVLPNEVGELLLAVGCRLKAPVPAVEGAHLADDVPLPEPVPPLRRCPRGRLTASLPRLLLPAFCCRCESSTRDRAQFHVGQVTLRLGWLRLLELGSVVTLLVPLCAACSLDARRARRRGVVFGVVASLVLFFSLLVAAAALKNVPPAPGVMVVLAVVNLVVTPIGGYKLADALSRPVLIERYQPSEATVDLWFRSRRYADALVLLHQGEDELAAKAAPTPGP